MKRHVLWLALAIPLSSCTSHLIFTENAHFGLKASFEPNTPTPAEVDLGWRRAMFAMVPQKCQADSKDGKGCGTAASEGSVTVQRDDAGHLTFDVVPDPNELMSMYAVFCGNIGFADPTEVHHFLATGIAASNLVANADALRTLAVTMKRSGSSCFTGTPALDNLAGGAAPAGGSGAPTNANQTEGVH
jgi:hypothetical protein